MYHTTVQYILCTVHYNIRTLDQCSWISVLCTQYKDIWTERMNILPRVLYCTLQFQNIITAPLNTYCMYCSYNIMTFEQNGWTYSTASAEHTEQYQDTKTEWLNILSPPGDQNRQAEHSIQHQRIWTECRCVLDLIRTSEQKACTQRTQWGHQNR